MKIKAVAKLAKDAQGLTLINGDERQHISADGAIYPLDGFPLLNEETVFAVLDVPVGERALYTVQQVDARTFSDFLADNQEGDLDATMTDMLVSVNGITLRPIYTPHGLIGLESMRGVPWHRLRRTLKGARRLARRMNRRENP